VENGFVSKLLAIRRAAQIGCSGAHQNTRGEWIPCSSIKQYMSLTEPMSVKSRTTILEMEKRSSRRKKKGKRKKRRWENLRERGVGGINSTPGVGLTSWNGKPGNPVGIVSGGRIPGIFHGNPNPPNVPGGFATKSLEEKSEQYSPRDNDTDVFTDIESARRRARQLGCIGVSRRMSKSGKIVWMPCTNMTDYNNLTGMTSLGRLNQEKNTQKVIRTVLSQELKKRKKSLVEEIMGKAIGPKISGVSRFAARTITQRFDPNAEDGDGDGLLQDGSAFERPNIPKPKLPAQSEQKPISQSSIDAVASWFDKTSSSRRQQLFGEPIENFSVRSRSTRGFASTSKPIKSEDFGIEGLENPDASPTNPFRNLGGKKMGQLIRGLVKPKNKGKKQRTTYLIGGTTGGGKTTVLDDHLVPKGLVPARDEAAHVDPDFIKMGLPGYSDGAGAPMVHDESLRAAQHTIDDARKDGSDVVATGAGSTRQRALIAQARRNGDRVVAHWVHVSQAEASRRLRQREKDQGRKIPDQTDHFARSIPRMVSSAVANGEVDEFYIWDNEVEPGKPPRLLASFKDGKLEVFDQKKLDEFMNGNPLEPKPGDKSVLSDEAQEALKESDEFMGFASSSKKKKGSRYTPPKNKPGSQQGRVGGSSPFGTQPGTGAQTSISTLPGIDRKIEARIQRFIQRLNNRITKHKDGSPKNTDVYLSKKLQMIADGGVYKREEAMGAVAGPPSPISIERLSLRGRLDTPKGIREVVEQFVPIRGSNETEDEFYDRLFDSIPALRYSIISDSGNRNWKLKTILSNIGYDPREQEKLRKVLEDELTDNPAFRSLVEEFGLPMMINGDGRPEGGPMGNASAYHTPFAALIVIGREHIKKGKHEAIGSSFDDKKFDFVQETLRHEWFHYLDSVMMAVDPQTFDARFDTYIKGLEQLASDPGAVVRKIFAGVDLPKYIEARFLEDAIREVKKQYTGLTEPQIKAKALEMVEDVLQNNMLQITLSLDALIDEMLFGRKDSMITDIIRDRGGIFDDVAKRYSEYARYGVHELIAEVGRTITSKPSERTRANNNISTIDKSTVDLLEKLFPSIPRGRWIALLGLSYPERQGTPGLEIKTMRKK
jgi:predicted ABC-type ATPase